MKKLFFLLLLMASITAFSQDSAMDDQPALRLIFNQADFGDRFAVLAEQDDVYNYFVTDLTKFSSRIEKTLFLNLVYVDDHIVSLDSDLSKDQLWFKAPADFTESQAICQFDDLKNEAVKKAASMTTEEISAWSEKYEKFNEKND